MPGGAKDALEGREKASPPLLFFLPSDEKRIGSACRMAGASCWLLWILIVWSVHDKRDPGNGADGSVFGFLGSERGKIRERTVRRKTLTIHWVHRPSGTPNDDLNERQGDVGCAKD